MTPAELFWRVWERCYDSYVVSDEPTDVSCVWEAAHYSTEDAAAAVNAFQLAYNGASMAEVRRSGLVRGVRPGEKERNGEAESDTN